MKRTIVISAIILAASAGLAWSGEPDSAIPPSQPANRPSPWLAGESFYFGDGMGAAANRYWGSAEFLLWSIKDGNVPPLVTAGPATATGGTLGDPGTRVLYGGDVDYDLRPGGRFTLGTWLDCDQTRGLEFSYFFLGGGAETFNAASSGATGTDLLGRPFINAVTGLPDRQIIGLPGTVAGNVNVISDSQLQGAQLNLLCFPFPCCQSDCCQPSCSQPGCSQPSGCASGCCDPRDRNLQFIAGFRYLQLDESLVISENLTFLPTAPAPFVPGSTINVVDRFETRNQFYGGQIGVRAARWRGDWFMNVLGTVALGTTHQEVRVSGSTVFTDPGGASVRQPGGLLAQPSNSGTRTHDVFTVVPEVGINVGRQLTDRLSVFAGYSFLYSSSVVRPGDQIDLRVNPTQLPSAAGPGTLVGPARPAPVFRDTDFWAQGVNLGLALRW